MTRFPSHPIHFGGAVLSIALLLVACGDEDNPGNPGGTIGDDPEQTARGVTSQIVLPLVRSVNLGTFIANLGAPLPPGFEQCQPLSICSGGSAQSCPITGGVEVIFTSCGVGGRTIDGTVEISGSSAQGTAVLSVAIDGVTLNGSMQYSHVGLNGECLEQQFLGITGMGSNYTMTLHGVLTYCDSPVVNGVVVPDGGGVLTFQFPELDKWVDLNFLDVYRGGEGEAGEIFVDVFNMQHTIHYVSCTGTLTGGLSCFTP